MAIQLIADCFNDMVKLREAQDVGGRGMSKTYVTSKMACWVCGDTATVKRDLANPKYGYLGYMYSEAIPDDSQRCYCENCFKKIMDELNEENKTYIRLKKKRMFETALDRMEHQKIRMYDYREAINTVYDYFMGNLDKFDSSYEIMAAIVLIYNHIHIKPQARIDRYQVDFMLDEEHIILEIDGERHKGRKRFDSDRDADIKRKLGSDWEIIRISTECLDMNVTRLVAAIDAVMDSRYKP